MTSVHIEHIFDVQKLQEIVDLQKRVWDAASVTSMHQMVAAIHHGGVVLAVVADGRIVGFCYGFPGFDGERVYLVSHMAAFDAGWQNKGWGKRLKEAQRRWALEHGYDRMVWTFDPLKARNAYFNLCKLGGTSQKYITDFYGDLAGLPEDRLLVEWELDSPRVKQALEGTVPGAETWPTYAKLLDWTMTPEGPEPGGTETASGEPPGWLLPVPREPLPPLQAKSWRFALRRAFQTAMANGYRVTGLWRTEEPVHYYVLEKEGNTD
ncbi:GNAT family N-acetyltransferase [Staphylospora marina]|uniref:GNAT family N-acetyltransferase n=1 Tax=Staphylospora marina TaxID=2490858 RepID=UPI000F5BBCAA|nr:GNAT family N-acetyltransferase [Staphylospora marina]